MKSIEVCFSPFHIPLYELTKKAVVVIDVYRATSAIVSALGNGVEQIIPVSTVDEAKEYKAKGYIAAAERKGAIVDGFDLGNSPIGFAKSELKGETVVLSTSNGTKALLKANNAKEIIVGAFLNIQAVVDYVQEKHNQVMFLCAGWRDRFNLEDTLVAGAMAELLLEKGEWRTECDSTLAAMRLWKSAEKDIPAFMKDASHTNRLAHLNLEDDISYCNRMNEFEVVPVYRDGAIKL